MIRKLGFNAYYLHPSTVADNFGGWDAGVARVRAASADRAKTMQVFKRARPPVSLQPRRKRGDEW